MPPGYANTFRHDEEGGEYVTPYVVTAFPVLMNRLSDAACRWVIAHELGHIASRLPFGSIVIHGKLYTPVKGTAGEYELAPRKEIQEDTADSIALEWGFDSELQAFFAED
jgi:hypothetical protein